MYLFPAKNEKSSTLLKFSILLHTKAKSTVDIDAKKESKTATNFHKKDQFTLNKIELHTNTHSR